MIGRSIQMLNRDGEEDKTSEVYLAHHWLVTYRGGEAVLAEFRRLFPSAPIACLVLRRGEIPDWIIGPNVNVSVLRLIPKSASCYKALLLLHSWAISRIRIKKGVRLLLSTDASMIKGVSLNSRVFHVCYCHSPPRYLWDMQGDYMKPKGLLARFLYRHVAKRLRAFDFKAAQRVNRFVANSEFVANRIRSFYGRESVVIHPPVAIEEFDWQQPSEDFYLVVSQLVPYKKVDIAVHAFNALGKRLVVIGGGSELKRLQLIAGPTVSLLGRQPFSVVKRSFESCRGFVYPQIEDFGITAVEAQAAGKPVIAFREGGALETIVDGETGLFFNEQSPEALAEAVLRFETMSWSAFACRRNAERFNPQRFRDEICSFLKERCPEVLKDWVRPVGT